MKTILVTGAAGTIGGRVRRSFKGLYLTLRLSDLGPPADLTADEEFVPADLADLKQVEKACAGVDGIVHLGGVAAEGPWETILNANIVGCYNLFEAARRTGVKRGRLVACNMSRQLARGL